MKIEKVGEFRINVRKCLDIKCFCYAWFGKTRGIFTLVNESPEVFISCVWQPQSVNLWCAIRVVMPWFLLRSELYDFFFSLKSNWINLLELFYPLMQNRCLALSRTTTFVEWLNVEFSFFFFYKFQKFF